MSAKEFQDSENEEFSTTKLNIGDVRVYEENPRHSSGAKNGSSGVANECHPETFIEQTGVKEFSSSGSNLNEILKQVQNDKFGCYIRKFAVQNDKKRKCAFTLAETLITLVIVGVVAALTVPTLISKYQEQALETKHMKAKSTVANAMKLLMLQSGSTDLLDSGLLDCYNSLSPNNVCLQTLSKKIFNISKDSLDDPQLLSILQNEKYKSAYLNFSLMPSAYASPFNATYEKPKLCIGTVCYADYPEPNSSKPWVIVSYAFVTTDGMVFGYERNLSYGFYIIADVNYGKNPNKVDRDLYRMFVNRSGKVFERNCEYTSSCTSNLTEK